MTWPGGAWPAARRTSADVVLVGDSVTSGSNASSYRNRSYAARLRSLLRARYGDGGEGFSPHWTGAPGGGVMYGTGTTEFASTGPNGHAYIFSAGNWRCDVDGTSVAVFLRRHTTYGTARWRVDGGPWQSVVCTGAPGYLRVAAEGLDPGVHRVEVEPVSGTVGIFGVEGRTPVGCRVHIMGLGGRTSGGNAFWSAQGETTAAFRAATVGRWSPHLLIVALGLNDSNSANTTSAVYKTNVEGLITTARAVRPDCDVVLVAQHLGRFSNNGYDAMRQALYDLADVHGAVVVDLDLWARTLGDGTLTGRTATDPTGLSWGRWATWGWWGTGAPGESGADSVHPGDAGHYVLARVLGDVLTVEEQAPLVDVEDFEFGGVG